LLSGLRQSGGASERTYLDEHSMVVARRPLLEVTINDWPNDVSRQGKMAGNIAPAPFVQGFTSPS